MTGDSELDVLQQALSGDVATLPALVDRWTPVVQARVTRVLRRYSEIADPRVNQEMEDLVQQVFVALLENEAAALRAWQPERGLSLDNWVGLIAEQQTLALLRTRKRNPWTDEPALIEELDRPSTAPDPEHETLGRDDLDHLLDRMQEQLSPLGWHLFGLLYLEELGVAAAAERSGLTPSAVYAWRSRLRRLARKLAGEVRSENGESSHKPVRETRTRVVKP